MNLSALKSFAPAVRRQLIEAVGRKLDVVLTGDTADLRAVRVQVEKLRHLAKADRKGLIERAAYTWFNRLSALRLLDARGWHPFRARVLTPATVEETQPEVLKLVRAGALPAELASLTDPARLNQLLDGHLPSSDPQGEVYRHLVLAACRFYHRLMPFLFEALDDETELLLPDDLLTAHSIAHGFRTAISDEDCAEVEVLGWLYQFYIAERKDQVMARKSAVPSEDIPAVTQLFTPHWIVRYLVENSLGRLWLLNRPGSRLREHMPYYIEGEPETDFLKITKPEDIRLLDPACGSGHMLTYAFDLLVKIYDEEGHAPSEIPGLILRHNLYGLEICPRAAQLAQFALVCKAREYARAAFRNPVQPQVMCLQDVVFDDDELQNFSSAVHCSLSTVHLKQLYQFGENTSTFGSLIQPVLSADEIAALKAKIGDAAPSGDLLIQETYRKICRALDQAEMLSQRYHFVVTNPPYMGGRFVNEQIKEFAITNFPKSKADMFAMFIERSFKLTQPSGYSAIVTMQSWMFLASFEEMRADVLRKKQIIALVQMANMVMGIAFGTVAFIIRNSTPDKYFKTHFSFLELNDLFPSGPPKEFPVRNNRLRLVSTSSFLKIPANPIAYWLGEESLAAFSKYPSLGKLAHAKSGQNTGDNDRFTRYWFEVPLSKINFSCMSLEATKGGKFKWYPYNKGGQFRKWYGNYEIVINWQFNGKEIKEYAVERNKGKHWSRYIQNLDFMLKEGLTWSFISSSHFGIRYTPPGHLFDYAGCSLFTEQVSLNILLNLLCSKVTLHFIAAINPTLNYQPGTISAIPVNTNLPANVSRTLEQNSISSITLAHSDWDNFETSWDFHDLPLLRPGLKDTTLEESWSNWAAYCRTNIVRMQELETENNRLWIDAYGLQDELTPEVPENEITLARPDRRKDIAAFFSYAVGCMMGRYRLDRPGLIYAHSGNVDFEKIYFSGQWTVDSGQQESGQWTVDSEQQDKVNNSHSPSLLSTNHCPLTTSSDGILPILDGDWFEDDIVGRTRQFLRVTFGDATLEANLRFIETSLGKDLRKYFLTDFYKDHLQTYKKRPIYWLFQSPKKGFNALIYLHRYNRDTANRVLNRYLREYLHKLQARLDQLDHIQTNAGATARDKTQARKESDQLRKIRRDCEEYERDILLPLAQQRLELDLDDGVKVNYLKLGNALAPIPGLVDSG